ncbi:MAG: PilZ domain-containing protein [Syntrophobacterales bacterium]|nr:MAG: PilZ domain-containing protein [Syntrophobacterales bacterium]
MTQSESHTVFTTREACHYLRISRPTYLKYVYEGKIRAKKVGKGWKVLKSELDRFLRGERFIPERRRYSRFPVDLPIDYTLMENGRTDVGGVANASEGGLMVFLNERMDVGTKMNVFVPFILDSEAIGLKATCKVVWRDVGVVAGGSRYKYGLQFVDIRGEDVLNLRRLGGQVLSKLPPS